MVNLTIIPARGATGINLGDTEQRVLFTLGEPQNRAVLDSGGVRLEYESSKVWLDEEGRVVQIGLYKGYGGKTNEGIGIGTTSEELRKLWGYDLAYHEDDSYWEFISRPGTLFEFETNEKGEEVVSVIYVARQEYV